MVKKKNYSDKEKKLINNRHIDVFNKSLDGIEQILDGLLVELGFYADSYIELPKTVITTLDFVVSSLVKIQKGQRLALGLDNEIISDDIEPEISIIEGIDLKKDSLIGAIITYVASEVFIILIFACQTKKSAIICF